MSGQKFSLTFTKRVEKRVLEPSAIRNETRVESSIPAPQTLHAIEGKSLQMLVTMDAIYYPFTVSVYSLLFIYGLRMFFIIH